MNSCNILDYITGGYSAEDDAPLFYYYKAAASFAEFPERLDYWDMRYRLYGPPLAPAASPPPRSSIGGGLRLRR